MITTVTPFHFSQQDFTGGMNYLNDATKVGDTEYPLLRNGRHRIDAISPVKKHLELSGLPTGKYQGLYSAGTYLIAFISGKAYYKNLETDAMWTAIVSFVMDAAVERIYFQLVDGSSVNFKRQLSTTSKNSVVNLTSSIGGSPKCAVVQDGVGQPWVIFPDGTARVTQNYDQWDDLNREYVPIGTTMFYADGILYIAGVGGAIYRSVTGRPLDFMVNITTTGEKGGPSEATGGAPTVAHRVDFDTIVAFSKIPTNPDMPGAFMVSTVNNSYIVVPDTVNTIFGEPTFSNLWLFSTGPINNFSFTDTVTDLVFIDVHGLRSFNSIRQIRVEGQNSPFSLEVSRLFETSPTTTIIQGVACATNFNNYALFGMQTIFGPAIVVYDTLTEKFVGIDQQDGVGLLKQWAEVKTTNARRLFFITQDNKIYEAYADTETAVASIYLGEWTSNEPQELQQNKFLRAVFSDIQENGTVTLETYVDRMRGNTITKVLEKTFTLAGGNFPFTGTYTSEGTTAVTFTATTARLGWKIGFLLSWNCQADLLMVSLDSDVNSAAASPVTQSKIWR